MPAGLTPRYAAPELLAGKPLTPRAEVYALGATVAEVLHAGGARLDPAARKALGRVVDRATADDAGARYPSADELGSALRRAAHLTDPAPGGLLRPRRSRIGQVRAPTRPTRRAAWCGPSSGSTARRPRSPRRSRRCARAAAW